MKDFEVHNIGTAKELHFSRALARAIEQSLADGDTVPSNIRFAYYALREYYSKQIDAEAV